MTDSKSIHEHVSENDENVKIWRTQITETENTLQSMLKDLDVELDRQNRLLSEARGKILQVEQLSSTSTQRVNERLQTLMVEQLVEIDKSELLAKVKEDNFGSCLQEISKWEPTMLELLVTGTVSGQGRHGENQQPNRGDAGVLLKDSERGDSPEKIVDRGEEQEDSEGKAVEEDISKVEEAVGKPEKEHAVLIEFLTERQSLPTGTESDGLRVDEDNNETQSGEGKHNLQTDREWADFHPTSNSSTQNLKTRCRAFEAKSAIMSKRVGNVHSFTKSQDESVIFPPSADAETTKDFGIAPQTQSLQTTGIHNAPSKRVKLNLYEIASQRHPTAQVKTPQKKPIATFKPKIPSTLRNRIN